MTEGIPDLSDNQVDGIDPVSTSRNWQKLLIGVIIVTFVVLYIVTASQDQLSSDQTEPADTNSAIPLPDDIQGTQFTAGGGAVLTSDDPAFGSEDASVKIVEFSDFECPFCLQAFPVVSRLKGEYEDRVRFQYRDFPISSIHAFAQKAAEAAECAHAQGRFWDYHDLLFENQQALTRQDLTSYAISIQLDIAAFNRCLDGGAKTGEVLGDLQDGLDAGVIGTPTFFVNGTKYEGVFTFEEFSSLIDSLLGE